MGHQSGIKLRFLLNTFLRKNRNILLILIIASLFLFYKIDKPFIGHHDYNGAVSGVGVRNYLGNIGQFFKIEKWQNIDNIYKGNLLFYPHYPPLSPLLFTVSGMILGVSELSLRIVTVIFSLLMLFFIYKIGERLYSKETGILAAFLTMVTPMFIYFGKAPDHEPILAPLCTAVFYFYLTANDKNKRTTIPFYVFLALALLESWASFFLVFFLLLHSIIYKWVKTKVIIVMVGMCISIVLLQLFLIFIIQGPEAITSLFQYGLHRMNMNPALSNLTFTWNEFGMTQLRYIVIYFTRFLTGLSIIWLLRYLLSWRSENTKLKKSMIILFLYPLAFILTFRNLAYIHDFKLYLFLPFFAISSASILINFLTKIGIFFRNIRIHVNWRYEKALVLTLFLIAVYMERLTFLRTLLLSSFDRPGYELGNRIRTRTSASDKVLLNSKEFDDFYKVFIEYYANRKVIAMDITLNDYLKNQQKYQRYRYIILVDNRPVDKKFEIHLLDNYPYERTGPYIFVDIAKNSLK